MLSLSVDINVYIQKLVSNIRQLVESNI